MSSTGPYIDPASRASLYILCEKRPANAAKVQTEPLPGKLVVVISDQKGVLSLSKIAN